MELRHLRYFVAVAQEKNITRAATQLFISQPALGSFLGEALQVFRQRSPQVEVRLFELSPGSQIEALRAGRLDIGLIGHACPEMRREFDLKIIHRIELVAVLCALHPLAGRASLKLSALKKEEFVGLDEAAFPGRNEVIREVCRKADFTPDIVHQADDLSSLLALVGSGSGVGLVPDDVEQLPHSNIVFKRLRAPKVHIDFHAALCTGSHSLIARTILEEFRNAAQIRSDKHFYS